MQPVSINAEARKTYTPPILRRLRLQRAKFILSAKIKTIFSQTTWFNRPKVVEIPKAVTISPKKLYEKPGFKKLTQEQAKLILIGQLSLGEGRAAELLEQIFFEPSAYP
ncbi:MAG TPA: hypothetical protein VHV29_08260 [Terriglobales bacterium]|nr:hypothetical protein [Terriglobales bacterium]